MGLYDTIFYVVLWCLILVAVIHCWRISCRGGQGNAAPQTMNQAADATSGTTSPQQQQESETDGIDRALLRSKVIETIFPGQTVDNNSTLVYDAESNSYEWTNDKTGDASCAICLECYEPGDVTISSQCGHVFHRECIMGWLLHHDKAGGAGAGTGAGAGGRVYHNEPGNDECPHCRQLMWDAETYKLVETELRAAWNHSEQ